jgi:fatty acid kinase fatty acid binding subunit
VIKIVTDSASGITPEAGRKHGIAIVPLYVHFGTETFRDGVDIRPADFFSRLKSSPQLPTTSQPSAGDFLEVYKSLTADGSEVVSVHLSNKLSGTVVSACTARDMLPNARIHVIDTQFIAAAQELMVMEAVRMAAAGQSAEAILARINKLSSGFHFYLTLETLEYLEKGGRIGKAAALLGTALQMKPIVEVRDGAVEAAGRVRSKSKAVAQMLELVKQGTSGRSRVYLGVMHAAALEEARAVETDLVSKLKPVEMTMAEIGPVVAVHTGPGTVGVAFYAE